MVHELVVRTDVALDPSRIVRPYSNFNICCLQCRLPFAHIET
jgi:hypothetical protein